jgi:hypothetical protein
MKPVDVGNSPLELLSKAVTEEAARPVKTRPNGLFLLVVAM